MARRRSKRHARTRAFAARAGVGHLERLIVNVRKVVGAPPMACAINPDFLASPQSGHVHERHRNDTASKRLSILLTMVRSPQ